MIRVDNEIKGIKIGEKQYKLKAFADDLVLTVQDPLNSVPRALDLINSFGKLAGFKLNMKKTKVISRNCTKKDIATLEKQTGLSFVQKVKYLGIYMTQRNINLYKDNYIRVWNEIKKDLELWTRLKLSLMGRISVVKMNVLPRMLFLFQMLPIIEKDKCFQEWQRQLTKFIWQGKKPRIKYKLLTDEKERGGFSLPDLELYYHAAAFCWLKDWFLLEDKDLLSLEGFNNLFGWHSYLWYDRIKANQGFKYHIIRKSLFKVWMRYKELLEPKTPWWLSPLEAVVAKLNYDFDCITYRDLLINVNGEWKMKPREMIKSRLHGWLQYHQINETFKKDLKSRGFSDERSKIETELLQDNDKNLSKMYKVLLEWRTKDEQVKSVMIKWAQDIGHNIMLEDWERLWKKTIKFTACTSYRENIMKMMYRWYLTPLKLAKMYKTSDSKCWKCKQHEGTFFHMWWTCPAIKVFWGKIYNELKKILKYTFLKKPEAFLLGILNHDLKGKDVTFFMYATTTARILIAQYWKTTEIPKIEEWRLKMIESMELAELTGRIRDLPDEAVTRDWTLFKDYIDKLTV